MKHLIIGDVHGCYHNLREFLIEQGAINTFNERINKDTLSVYCSGDLIDGGKTTREGDLLILEYVEEWFDKVAIGNHELALLGGLEWGGSRKNDRTSMRKLLDLELDRIYVPAFVVDKFLVVHAGLAERWSFYDVEDALEAIEFVWDNCEGDDDTPMIDWIGPARAGKYADDTGGIFWLDWDEERNTKINQIVGHSTRWNGPVKKEYPEHGTVHWNIDVGGKANYGLGGVIIENGNVTPVFWGTRLRQQGKHLIPVFDDNDIEYVSVD